MTDPYKVLGVSPNATDEQVKNAYRELARKYHPDNYQNNPLADLASEKMKEINEAYDTVMKMRRNGTGSGGSYGAGSAGSYSRGGYGASSSTQFADVRRLINQNRISEADELLSGIPSSSRDAEWYFLKGSIFYTRGWLDEAFNHFAQACRMNPNNPEYTAAYNQLMWQRQTASPGNAGPYRQPTAAMGGCSVCDMCSGLVCADCCCECFGGDLISCC